MKVKVSDLVALRNKLTDFSLTRLQQEISQLVIKAESLPVDMHTELNHARTKLIDLPGYAESIDINISQTIKLIDAEIIERTKNWTDQNYNIDGDVAPFESDVETERTNRKTNVIDEIKEKVIPRVQQHTSWQHPVLEIGPGDGYWTGHLVSGDPLYLLDIHAEFLDSTTKQFNQFYQKKIRRYLIGKSVEKTNTDLSALPINQFGFIFSWGLFDFLPQTYVDVFLTQCFNLLKPGGVMMFSYNNCEFEQCAAFAEEGFKSWLPKTALCKLLHTTGFEILYHGSNNSTVHWIEISKPGTLKSIRSHQALATILPKPGFENVDNAPTRVYNKQQIARLRQIAMQMNLADPEDIVRGEYAPHKLHEMIETARKQK